MSLKRPINDPNDSSNEQNQPTSEQQAFMGQIVFSGAQLKLFSANEEERLFLDEWILGSVFLMTWLCKHKYMYLFRANKGQMIIPSVFHFCPNLC